MRTCNSTWCCQTVFHENFSNLYSHQECLRLCIDVHPLLHLMFHTLCQYSGCAVISHDALSLDFSDCKWSWTSFHTLICHLRSLFCENTANSSSHWYFYSFFLLISKTFWIVILCLIYILQISYPSMWLVFSFQ